MNLDARIFVAGARTLIGRALIERLRSAGYHSLVGADGDDPELTNRAQTDDFFADQRPEYVFLVAGLSGGIELNRTRPTDLALDNLQVTMHVLHAAHEQGVQKLLYLASSCSYPREAAQPLREESLMTGPLEPTSEPYAMAKLVGWSLCRAYRRQHGDHFVTAIPANAFGPHDDFSHEDGHIIPGLMRRAHEARESNAPSLTVWGTGTPRREFIFSRDLADACLFVMEHYEGEGAINLGTGLAFDIATVARAVMGVVGYPGTLHFDTSRPDGAPVKMLDSSKLRSLGWKPQVEFHSALQETYNWFLHHAIKEGRHHGYATAVSSTFPDSPR